MIGYLDLPSGLSGDMFLSCLVDAGWPIGQLQQVVEALRLPPGSVSLLASQVMRRAVRATHVQVKTTETHHHRHLADIRSIIDAATLPEPVQERAKAVFERLAAAEAKVHGTTVDQIHFHEVGALDAIADIVGVCAGVHALGIERLYASPLPVGPGWVESAHGLIPLPAPATLELLASVHAPIRSSPASLQHRPDVVVGDTFAVHHHAQGPLQPPGPQEPPPVLTPRELVTPTAAALLAEMATFEQPTMRLHRIAVGAGTLHFAWPNVARLWLGEMEGGGPLLQIETNIDDMNPQLFPAVCERLFAAGAVDVWLSPIQMKKGRPAVLLSVLSPSAREQAMADILLRETTTLGLRIREVRRHEAEREFRTLETPFGIVRIKLKRQGGTILGAMPEFEDCRKLAEEKRVPLRAVQDAAIAAAQDLLRGGGDNPGT